MRRSTLRSLGFLLLFAGAASPTFAAEITDVASSFDDDHPFGFRLRVGYWHDQTNASIKREGENPNQTEVGLFKDLLYSHSRDWMAVRAEIGIYQDLAVYGELPFVLADSREYRFDQSLGSACIYPGMAGTPNCVNAMNSTTIADGIVPMNGYDATNSMPGVPVGFSPGSDLVFRGVSRGGSGLNSLDTINIGIKWAPLSQARDDTKPTWIVDLQGQISIGNIMAFDRMRPDANHAVSEGLHHLIAKTAVSHRFKYVEPYAAFWYNFPIARDDSLFINYGPTQKNADPQQSAGTIFGFEGIPWERPDKYYKIALDLRGRIEGHFDGRGYSEGWELFASSDALTCDPMWNPSCDPSKVTNKYQGMPYTGLTVIENYATLGADIALVVQAGRYLHFNIGLQYSRDQSHFITIDDVGRAWDATKGDGCSVPIAGRVSRPCEFNPAFRPVIDEVGRRYKVDNVDMFRFGVWAQAMF